LITLAEIFELPLKLRSYAGKVVRRAQIKYAGHGMSESEVLRHLDALYDTPDPWRMTSQKEQFRFARTNDILVRQLIAPAPQVGSILEVGCGEGHQSEHLGRLCAQLTGIDVVPTAIERARMRVPCVEWVVGNLEDQPWVREGRKFDIVTACEVLYAFRDIPKTLQLMSRLGQACLVTYFAGAAHAVERPLRAMPLKGRESFVFDDVTWHVVWWRTT
jgi:SAM-dependent methyltransferase